MCMRWLGINLGFLGSEAFNFFVFLF